MSLTDGSNSFSNSTGSNPSYRSIGGGRTRLGWFGNGGVDPKTQPDIGLYNQAAELYGRWNQPSQDILQQKIDSRKATMGMYPINQAEQTQALNQQYQSQMAQNQLGIQSLGIDQNAIPRQSQYFANLYGIDKEKYNNNMGYQGQLKGFSTEDYNSVVRQLANQANQINYTADKNIRGIQSQATAAGSYTSAGAREGRYDVNADRMFGLANNNEQGKQANVGYRKDQAGITNTMQNLTSDFKAAGLTEQEQQARLRDRGSQLAIQAQQLGLKSGELSAQLQSGLSKLNLDTAVNVGQLMDGIYSDDYQQQQIAMQIFTQAYQAGMLR